MSSNPLLERVKFLSIFSTNLDEFFMIRVCRHPRADRRRCHDALADGKTPTEQMIAIRRASTC